MHRTLFLMVVLGLAGRAFAADSGSVHPRDSVRDAVLAPLEDLNLKETPIPEVLSRARSDPYALTGLGRCEGIAAEIGRLDAALGPDLDEAPPPDKRSRAAKIADEVRGAAAHDKKLTAAVRAGEIRQGFLKGTGMRMNCAPPAAPSWFVPARPHKPAPPPSLWERFLAWVRSWWPF